MKKIYLSLSLVMSVFIMTAQKTSLELKLKPQEVYYQNSISTSAVTQTIQGQEIEMNLEAASITELKVVEANADSYLMDVKYVGMSMEMSSMAGSMSYDGLQPKDGDPASQMLANMIGKTFQVVIDKQGKVLETKNIQVIWEGMEERNTGLIGPNLDALIDQMKVQYSENNFAANLELTTNIYPKQEVAVGESWTVEGNIVNNIVLNLKTTYTLESVNGDKGMIKASAVISTPADAGTAKSQGIEMEFKLDGTMESLIEVNLTTGWATASKMEQKMKGSAKTVANSTMPMSMTIPMEVTSIIEISDSLEE
ncbi:MAG: DUF6263 family protein [Flavobacteriaceae bacterium]